MNRHGVILFTDGASAYVSLFPELFGVPFEPIRDTHRGRRPNIRYSILRSLAYVQIISKLESIGVRYRHGSRKQAQDTLYRLRYTAAHYAQHGHHRTTQRHGALYEHHTDVSHACLPCRHPLFNLALGRWTLNVSIWCRTNRMLKQPLCKPIDRKQCVQRTPAMILGLVNHIFGAAELLRTPVFPKRLGDNLN